MVAARSPLIGQTPWVQVREIMIKTSTERVEKNYESPWPGESIPGARMLLKLKSIVSRLYDVNMR